MPWSKHVSLHSNLSIRNSWIDVENNWKRAPQIQFWKYVTALAIQVYHQSPFWKSSLFIQIKNTTLSLDKVYITGSLITSHNIAGFWSFILLQNKIKRFYIVTKVFTCDVENSYWIKCPERMKKVIWTSVFPQPTASQKSIF